MVAENKTKYLMCLIPIIYKFVICYKVFFVWFVSKSILKKF